MTLTKKSLKTEWMAHAEQLAARIEVMESGKSVLTWAELFDLLKQKTASAWAVHLKESGDAVRATFDAGQSTRSLFEQAKAELSQPLIKR